MSTYPRYVPHNTGDGKWDNHDINAVVDHVNGSTASGIFAYPFSFVIRALAGGFYDAVNSIGTRVYGGTADEGGVDGTNASDVIQAAIDACGTAGGGNIYVKKGSDYAIDTTIVMKTRVNLLCERGVAFKSLAGLVTMILIDDVQQICISDLRLEGQSTSNTGILISDISTEITLQRLEIYDVVSRGLWITTGYSWGNHIIDCIITANGGGYAVDLDNAHLITFDCCRFGVSTTHAYIHGDAMFNTFFRCHFTQVAAGSAAMAEVKGDGAFTPRGNSFIDCWFEQGVAGNARGIEINDVGAFTTRPYSTKIDNCHFGIMVYGIEISYGADTIVINPYTSGMTAGSCHNISAGATDTVWIGGYDAQAKTVLDNGVQTRYPDGFLDQGARVYKDAAQTIAHNTPTALTWETVQYDASGMFNVAAPTRLTAKRAGTYLVSASVFFAGSATGVLDVAIKKNGSIIANVFYPGVTFTGTNSIVTVNSQYSLTSGEYFEVFVTQTSTTNMDVYSNAPYTAFNMVHIGT